MNKFRVLRTINDKLRYSPIKEYIGVEIPIDISSRVEVIIKEIKTLIEENLGIKVGTFKGNDIEGTIAKYGLIDVNFEVETDIGNHSTNGLKVLRENGWVDDEGANEYKEAELAFLEDMIPEIEENKTYIKVYSVAKNLSNRSFKQKSYLLKQMIKKTGLKPLPEDKIQIFRVEDICYTNYSGIWLWKYFYM